MCAIMLLHLSTALLYVNIWGIDILVDSERNRWDWFWQTLPIDLLRADLLSGLWHLHAQPPLFNLYGGLLAKAFYPHHLEAMHFVNILMGSLLCGLVYLMTARFSPHRVVALAWSAILALNPALFLYEAYILYTLPSAFLVVLHLSCLLWYERTKSESALYGFVGGLNLLILMRSVYHVALIPAALLLVWTLSNRKDRMRRLWICAAISLLSLGWCAKNQIQFGFFGTSSWTGLGLWRIASAEYTQSERVERFIADELDRLVIERPPFSSPSSYEPYGFVERSNVPSLSNDDLNNINIPAISACYGVNAARLIMRSPSRYARTVYRGYARFCRSSSNYLALNAAKISYHVKIYDHYLQGAALRPSRRDIGVLLFALLPISLLLYSGQFIARCAHYRWNLQRASQADCFMLWCFAIILYTTVVACTMEYGENERFKFLIEQPIWVFIPVVIGRAIQPLISTKRTGISAAQKE